MNEEMREGESKVKHPSDCYCIKLYNDSPTAEGWISTAQKWRIVWSINYAPDCRGLLNIIKEEKIIELLIFGDVPWCPIV